MRCRPDRSFPVILGLFIAGTVARADLVVIGPSKDNTLYEDPKGMLGNGMGQHFFAGHTAFGVKRRGVIAFDVAASIPPGSTINSVTLTMRMSKTSAGLQPVTIHRLLNDWGEGASDAPGEEGAGGPEAPGDATWIHTFAPDSFWSNVGGDFVSIATASQSVGGIGFYTWGSTPRMVNDVQGWLNNSATNFGWLVRGNETGVLTAKRFDSKDHSNAANHPMLSIEFTPAPLACNTCLGDVDDNGLVNAADIRAFVDCYINGAPDEADCICADMDESALFDGADVESFVTNLLTVPDPDCP